MIYLLTAIGLTPGGCCTVYIYTKQHTEQNKHKQYIEQHNKQLGRMRAVPRLCELYTDICLTTGGKKKKKKTRKNQHRVTVKFFF